MPIETREEYFQRHGEHVRLEDGRLAFADGAFVVDGPGFFQMNEPPAEERLRLEIIISYWRARLLPIREQLVRLKSHLRGELAVFVWDSRLAPPPPSSDGPGLAVHLAQLAAEPKAKLAEAEQALASLPANQAESVRERRLKKALRRRQLRQQEQQQEVLQTTI